ncbi:hypothetical protein FJT64_018761 [Amphibalanus amphitrite]|nr:hypothetical protein FJT64_018761 [Amphibalanus amphitrite]
MPTRHAAVRVAPTSSGVPPGAVSAPPLSVTGSVTALDPATTSTDRSVATSITPSTVWSSVTAVEPGRASRAWVSCTASGRSTSATAPSTAPPTREHTCLTSKDASLPPVIPVSGGVPVVSACRPHLAVT